MGWWTRHLADGAARREEQALRGEVAPRGHADDDAQPDVARPPLREARRSQHAIDADRRVVARVDGTTLDGEPVEGTVAVDSEFELRLANRIVRVKILDEDHSR